MFVVILRTRPLEHISQVNLDDDPINDGALGVWFGAKHCEDGCVLSRLGDQSKYTEFLLVELVLVPREALVNGILQDVCSSFSLEILDSDDDASMVSDVVVIVALQHLVPAQTSVSGQEHVGLVLQRLAHVGGGQDDARCGGRGQDRDGPRARVQPRHHLGDVERAGVVWILETNNNIIEVTQKTL